MVILKTQTDKAPSFCEMVYELISMVPHGKVTTYKDIAENLGYPGYARQTAYCLSRLATADTNNVYKDVPWHRVIRSDMRVAFEPASDKFKLQHSMLRKEGVVPNAVSNIAAKKYSLQSSSTSSPASCPKTPIKSQKFPTKFPSKYRYKFGED